MKHIPGATSTQKENIQNDAKEYKTTSLDWDILVIQDNVARLGYTRNLNGGVDMFCIVCSLFP